MNSDHAVCRVKAQARSCGDQSYWQDIARINRWRGGQRVLLRVLSDVASSREEFSVLDVGATSGDMRRCIREAFPNAKCS
jgi:hypothetical protein